MTNPDDEAPEYATTEVAELTGCSFRMLDYYIRTGRIHVLNDAPGSGQMRWVRRHEVNVLVTVLALLEAGFKVDKAFEYGRRLVETDEPVQVGCVTIGGSS